MFLSPSMCNIYTYIHTLYNNTNYYNDIVIYFDISLLLNGPARARRQISPFAKSGCNSIAMSFVHDDIICSIDI